MEDLDVVDDERPSAPTSCGEVSGSEGSPSLSAGVNIGAPNLWAGSNSVIHVTVCYLATRYIIARYEFGFYRIRDPRDASPRAPVGLRDQGDGRQIGPVLWAASYGQIYPELRKLAKAGLVEPEAQPTGRRKRIVYRLTDAGREELRNWLDRPSARLELRDEGLLKLFFGGAAEPGKAIEIIDAKQRLMEEKVAALRETEPFAAAAASSDPFPYLVLRYGVESSEWVIAWCARARAELTGAVSESANRKRGAG